MIFQLNSSINNTRQNVLYACIVCSTQSDYPINDRLDNVYDIFIPINIRYYFFSASDKILQGEEKNYTAYLMFMLNFITTFLLIIIYEHDAARYGMQSMLGVFFVSVVAFGLFDKSCSLGHHILFNCMSSFGCLPKHVICIHDIGILFGYRDSTASSFRWNSKVISTIHFIQPRPPSKPLTIIRTSLHL